jgi:hypothetical protein
MIVSRDSKTVVCPLLFTAIEPADQHNGEYREDNREDSEQVNGFVHDF